MRRWYIAGLGLVIGALIFAGCGSSSSSGGATTGSASGQVKVGMALPGPKNDRGFNQAHYEGLLLAEKQFGITGHVVENLSDPQTAVDAFRNLAETNNLVIGVGAQFQQASVTVAPQFPKVTFVVINGAPPPNIPNLHSYVVRQGVPAYVIGALAAKLSKAHSVGFVGGAQIPPTTQGSDAFKAGAQATSPGVKVASTVTGDYNDATKAKEAASAQIANGADVIYGALDAGFPGAEDAATSSGKPILLFNQIISRCNDGKNIVGYNLLNSSVLVTELVGDFLHHTIPSQPKAYGLQDPRVQKVVLCPAFNRPDLQKLVRDTTAAINSGKITLPSGV